MSHIHSHRRPGPQSARTGYLSLTRLLFGCLVIHLFLAVWAVLVNLAWRTADLAFFAGFAWIAPMMLVLGMLGRVPRTQIILTLIVIALLVVQALLIGSSRDLGVFAVSGLHLINAFILLGVAAALGRHARRLLRTRDTEPPQASPCPTIVAETHR
jgi:hypothetical protein